jgi:hypothetical protein
MIRSTPRPARCRAGSSCVTPPVRLQRRDIILTTRESSEKGKERRRGETQRLFLFRSSRNGTGRGAVLDLNVRRREVEVVAHAVRRGEHILPGEPCPNRDRVPRKMAPVAEDHGVGHGKNPRPVGCRAVERARTPRRIDLALYSFPAEMLQNTPRSNLLSDRPEIQRSTIHETPPSVSF